MNFQNTVLSIVAALLFSWSGNAQLTLLSEDFNSGIPASWAVVDADGLSPEASVSEFTAAWINYQGTDTTAASTSFYDPSGQSEDYLILPKLSLLSFTKLVWQARSVDASYPDSYYVLVSTTDSLPASFTDTLLAVHQESYLWKTHSIHLDTAGYATQDVYVAFRNFTTDGFILELDNILVLSDDNASIPVTESVELSIFPNPVSEVLSVACDQPVEEIRVYTMNGEYILNSSDSQLSVNDLSNGTYILEVRTADQILHKRFIKN